MYMANLKRIEDDSQVADAVKAARQADVSWDEIAQALGMTSREAKKAYGVSAYVFKFSTLTEEELNARQDEIEQMFIDLDPEDGVRSPDEVVALGRAYANAKNLDDPAVIDAVRDVRAAGLSWDWVGQGVHMLAPDAERYFGNKLS